MKIRFLYFEGCPNHRPVVEMARRLVDAHRLDAEIEEVEVSPDDVARHRFLGSPTVQVDGVDIDPAAHRRTDYAMSCRVYATPDRLPSERMLLDALGVSESHVAQPRGCCSDNTALAPSEQRIDPAEGTGLLATGGSVASAVLSSACCWLPLVLLTFGASAAGVSAFFARWRPLFIAGAVAMLGLGFYLAYLRRAACAAGCRGEPRARARQLHRGMLWVSAAIVAAFVFFPRYVGLILGGGGPAGASAAAAAERGGQEYVFEIEGMHCEGCATMLRNALHKLDGVTHVGVDYAANTARVEATGPRVPERVVEATARAGYTARLRSER